jgi:hypothetical protein
MVDGYIADESQEGRILRLLEARAGEGWVKNAREQLNRHRVYIARRVHTESRTSCGVWGVKV